MNTGIESKRVSADSYGITFTLPTGSEYKIAWWQIRQDGFACWHDQLSDKNWFTDQDSRAFTHLCDEYLSWN